MLKNEFNNLRLPANLVVQFNSLVLQVFRVALVSCSPLQHSAFPKQHLFAQTLERNQNHVKFYYNRICRLKRHLSKTMSHVSPDTPLTTVKISQRVNSMSLSLNCIVLIYKSMSNYNCTDLIPYLFSIFVELPSPFLD